MTLCDTGRAGWMQAQHQLMKRFGLVRARWKLWEPDIQARFMRWHRSCSCYERALLPCEFLMIYGTRVWVGMCFEERHTLSPWISSSWQSRKWQGTVPFLPPPINIFLL